MSHAFQLANALLWATAIVASAVMGAPAAVSGLLLPALAAGSLLMAMRHSAAGRCGR